MYLLLNFACWCTAWQIPYLIPCFTISSISVSISNSSSTSVFFRNVCHANPNANKKFVRSSTYNDTLTVEAVQYIHCNIVSICIYKSWYCPRFCILKSSQASNVKLLLNCNNILWNFANYPCAYMHKHSSRDTWQNLLRSPSKNLLIFWNLLDRSLIDSFIIFVTVYTFKC